MTRRLRLSVRIPLLPPPERWSAAAKLVFLLVFALFISVAVRSVFGERGVVELLRLRGQAARLESDVTAMQTQLAQEVVVIRELRDGEEIIERLARERLNMAKPGEVTYLLLGERGPPDPLLERRSGDTSSP